jgi:hypothetical protein
MMARDGGCGASVVTSSAIDNEFGQVIWLGREGGGYGSELTLGLGIASA